MSQQYLRTLRLTVGDSDGAYDLSNLRVRFQIQGATAATLKYAEITVWNLSKEKANEVLTEFTYVRLEAGYGDAAGSIFYGQINRVAIGKENATDSFVRIWAQDGDQAKNWCLTRATLAAGWTDEDLFNQLMQDFSAAALTLGYEAPIDTSAKGARARTLLGKTEAFMSELAERQNCDWWIHDGQVYLLPKGTTLPGADTPVLSPATGLIGVPQLDINGISVRCLLNPNIKQGSKVQIAGDLINIVNQQAPRIDQAGEVIPQLSGTGNYKVHCVIHSGDSRGNDWYTDMICTAVDAIGPAAGPTLYDVPEGP